MKQTNRVVPASEGSGPLLQRDYWIVMDAGSNSPEKIMESVRKRFPDFAPKDLAAFAKESDGRGERVDIRLALAGDSAVRVVHSTPLSLTLRTLEGHPEAGRITFGATRLEDGRIEFRIRSRARANGWFNRVGYALLGKSMQTDVWVEFVGRVAELARGCSGDGVQIEEREVEEDEADRGESDSPTFIAKK